MNFTKIYSQFLAKKTNDLIDGVPRVEIRTKAVVKNDQKLLDTLKSKPKEVPLNNLSKPINNPFDILNFTDRTEVQKLVEKHAEIIQYHGAFTYTCSCGSGKTICGLYLMYKLQCKTLIISSRNAVNDQWEYMINKVYPELKIGTLDVIKKDSNCDVYIFTPQFLASKITTKELDFLDYSLVIYDEIHSLVSDVFSNVLYFPFYNVVKGKMTELPYMISLSATLPIYNTKEAKLLRKLFGTPFKTKSIITTIPVNIVEMQNKWNCIKTVDYFIKQINNNEGIKYGIIDEEHKLIDKVKGIIMTYTIDSSIYAGLLARKTWNCNVLIVRAVNEKCILLEKDKNLTYKFDKTITYDKMKQDINEVGYFCELSDIVNQCQIIAGTHHRLKEGFSVQNITWGICTKFVYSLGTRVQCVGRVRRYSKDTWLNEYPRVMFTNASDPPTNYGLLYSRYKNHKRARSECVVTYDYESEMKVFDEENYKCVKS